MIVADRKPLDEILESIRDYRKIMVMGCGGCVTVCFSGGAKAAEVLASQIRMAREKEGKEIEIVLATPERQCEYEYIDASKPDVTSVEAVLSTACGVGVQAMAERYPQTIVIPALNTKFMGYPVQHGLWEERCAGCGNCVLEWTGGLCPIARCAKKLLNGPCGGSSGGKCETSTPENPVDCVWQLIYDRLQRLGRSRNLSTIRAPKDWRPATETGQRKIRFEEMML
jgi:ferredoxin